MWSISVYFILKKNKKVCWDVRINHNGLICPDKFRLRNAHQESKIKQAYIMTPRRWTKGISFRIKTHTNIRGSIYKFLILWQDKEFHHKRYHLYFCAVLKVRLTNTKPAPYFWIDNLTQGDGEWSKQTLLIWKLT